MSQKPPYHLPLSLVIRKKSSLQQKGGLCIIISKNVVRRAVERNLLRRRIRAIFRTHYAANASSYVVTVKPSANTLSFQELERVCCDGVDKTILSTVH